MRLVKRGETTCSHEENAQGWLARVRGRLADSAHYRLGPAAPWVQRHVAACPRCQQRLAAFGKVDVALSLIKSQPHRLDLLMRANTAAIHMLSRQLREAPEAGRLKEARPELSPVERYARYQGTITGVAACLAILLLTKAGIFTSLDKARTRGEAAMKQYYLSRAGEDLTGEIFKT